MQKISIVILATLLLLFLPFIGFNPFDTFGQVVFSTKPHVAILNLEGRGISDNEAATLTDQLRGYLVNLGAFIVLDRGKMEDILKEQGFQQSGCTLTECAVRAGRMLNVQKMVTGSVGKIGKTYAINISMIDVQSGRIERSFNRNYQGEIDGLLEILHDIAREMAGKKSHKLTIYSAPKDAEVTINKKLIGKTPLTCNVIAGSRIKIRLRYPGYRDWEQALTMTRDEDFNVEMVAKSSSRTWLWVAGGVSAAAIGATAYILTSSDDGSGTKTASLPAFPWPPAGK
ncbi:MAG: PEGA domain-containing protein [candidate division KSB1 bacterium]|nr:PEGA domain-containing protein [candidate division KSB1 bacterium]MDZ7303292.1 PEGA domain-containing protein [candidate division KSB1 bacterium]MDZ7312595.1 PEGA domain-containing protein [candidate division KSB1 bacterium]